MFDPLCSIICSIIIIALRTRILFLVSETEDDVANAGLDIDRATSTGAELYDQRIKQLLHLRLPLAQPTAGRVLAGRQVDVRPKDGSGRAVGGRSITGSRDSDDAANQISARNEINCSIRQSLTHACQCITARTNLRTDI